MQNQVVQDCIKEIKVKGQILSSLPQDLYIPPDALRVFLETFEGPLDLLLYLIRKQNIDILDIPIANITRQYMEYVELMQVLQIELAAEYLLMAAMLAEIKSRLLLPRSVHEEDEVDPRAELIERLQEYERIKKASQDLDALPRLEREIFQTVVMMPQDSHVAVVHPDVSLDMMLNALKSVLVRSHMNLHHQVIREPLSIRERMSLILAAVNADHFTPFVELFSQEEGRMGIVVTLIAILELIRQMVIELVQSQPYAPIYIKAKG